MTQCERTITKMEDSLEECRPKSHQIYNRIPPTFKYLEILVHKRNYKIEA